VLVISSFLSPGKTVFLLLLPCRFGWQGCCFPRRRYPRRRFIRGAFPGGGGGAVGPFLAAPYGYIIECVCFSDSATGADKKAKKPKMQVSCGFRGFSHFPALSAFQTVQFFP